MFGVNQSLQHEHCASASSLLVLLFVLVPFVISSEAEHEFYHNEILQKVHYIPLPLLMRHIHDIEDKMDYLEGRMLVKWSRLHERLVVALRARTKAFGGEYCPVFLVEGTVLRKITFEIHASSSCINFKFISGSRATAHFNTSIKTTALFEMYGLQAVKATVLIGTMMVMLHPNGLGLQINVNNVTNLLSITKSVHFGRASMVKIFIYQRTPSVILDNHCVRIEELLSREKRHWNQVQSTLANAAQHSDNENSTEIARRMLFDSMGILM